jgi:hypothetical protein
MKFTARQVKWSAPDGTLLKYHVQDAIAVYQRSDGSWVTTKADRFNEKPYRMLLIHKDEVILPSHYSHYAKTKDVTIGYLNYKGAVKDTGIPLYKDSRGRALKDRNGNYRRVRANLEEARKTAILDYRQTFYFVPLDKNDHVVGKPRKGGTYRAGIWHNSLKKVVPITMKLVAKTEDGAPIIYRGETQYYYKPILIKWNKGNVEALNKQLSKYRTKATFYVDNNFFVSNGDTKGFVWFIDKNGKLSQMNTSPAPIDKARKLYYEGRSMEWFDEFGTPFSRTFHLNSRSLYQSFIDNGVNFRSLAPLGKNQKYELFFRGFFVRNGQKIEFDSSVTARDESGRSNSYKDGDREFFAVGADYFDKNSLEWRKGRIPPRERTGMRLFESMCIELRHAIRNIGYHFTSLIALKEMIDEEAKHPLFGNKEKLEDYVDEMQIETNFMRNRGGVKEIEDLQITIWLQIIDFESRRKVNVRTW